MSDHPVATIPRAIIYTCGSCGCQMAWDRWQPCACRERGRPRMTWRGLPLALLLSGLLWLVIIAGLAYGVRVLAPRAPAPVPAAAAPHELLLPTTPGERP